MSSSNQREDKKRALPELLQLELPSFWPGQIMWQEEMARYTTFKVGGPAQAVVFPRSQEELSGLLSGLQQRQIPWWVIGRGSNILVPDEGLAGVVIVLARNFSTISMVPEEESERYDRDQNLTPGSRQYVRAEAGCSLAKLVRWTAERQMSGLEFLAGIPGSVGGALVMNAGAWGREMSEVVAAMTVMDNSGALRELSRRDCRFSYRKCDSVLGLTIVTGVLELKKGQPHEIMAAIKEAEGKRKAKQPLNAASAGSFFKNPAGQPAGKLIEQAGLKGFRIGDAEVSGQHANFIVNKGKATAREIVDLMQYIQQKVMARTGIWLEPEVHILGFDYGRMD